MKKPSGLQQQGEIGRSVRPLAHPSLAQLLPVLTAEHTALLNFIVLLEQEQEILVENRTDQLLELSQQKSTDALRLNELTETRRSLLQKNIPQLSVDTIRAWLKTHSPNGLAIWLEVITLTKRAQRLNQTNNELLQMKLRHNQQSLVVLNNAVKKTNLYGSNGQPSFSAGNGRSLGIS